MIAQIRLSNSIDSSNSYKEFGNTEIIKGFSMNSFVEMEKEYEHSWYHHPYEPNSKRKLANICCNVLKNGDFDIKDTTNYLID